MRYALVVMVLCGCNNGSTQPAWKHAGKSESPISVPPDMTPRAPTISEAITANELIAFYVDNEIAGDKRFKGKRIRVKGIATEISKVFGDPYVSLRGPGIGSVMCYFNREWFDLLAGWHRNAETIIDCDVNGLSATNTSVVLKKCDPTRRKFATVFPSISDSE